VQIGSADAAGVNFETYLSRLARRGDRYALDDEPSIRDAAQHRRVHEPHGRRIAVIAHDHHPGH